MKTVIRKLTAVLLAAVMVCLLVPTAAVTAADAPAALLSGGETARMEMTGDKLGLAFRFTLTATGVKIGTDYKVNLSKATVDIGGTAYPLRSVGALVSNDPTVGLSPAQMNHDNFSPQTKIVNAVYANELTADGMRFTVRVTNIPVAKSDAVVYARPFFAYECDGDYVVVYGDIVSANYDNNINTNDGVFDW